MLIKKTTGAILFFFLITMYACQEKNRSHKLLTNLFEQTSLDPDTIMPLLDSLKDHTFLTKNTNLHWNLLYIREYEKKHSELPSDSIVYITTNYFISRGNNLEKAYSYFYLGRLNYNYGNENNALHYYMQALEASKEVENYELSGRICQYMGEVYWEESDYQEYIDIIKRGLSYFRLAKNTQKQILSFRDIARGFLYKLEYDSALLYCNEGELIARKVNDVESFLKIYYEIGSIHWVKKDYELAELYIRKSLEATTDSSMRIKQRQLLTSIYIQEEKYEQAKELLLPLLHHEKISQVDKVANYHRMSNIEKGLHNYEDALKWYTKFKLLNDTVMYQRMDIDTKKVEISNKLEKLIHKNRKLRKITICSISGILLVLILGVYFFLKSNKYKEKLKIAEKENASLYHEKTDLEKELLERSNFLQKANLLIQTPSHKRKELEVKMEKIFESSQLTENDWMELEDLVNKAQNNFAHKLRKKYNNLTEEEKRTLILIRLGISNSYLASLFDIQVDSIMTKRYRIRKKIGIPKDVSLEDFINNLFT